MKKRSLFVFLLLICILTCTLCLAACDFGGNNGGNDGSDNNQQSFTVTFVTNGGTEISPIKCDTKKSLANILGDKTTTKKGKVFIGWFKDGSLQEEFPLNLVVSSDTTVYAGWRDYTDAEMLENAIIYAYNNAVAIKDVGFVRTGISSSSQSSGVDAVFTLKGGTITSASDSSRHYSDGYFYCVIDKEKTKLKPNDASEAAAFIYHNDKFKSLGFFQAFSTLAMARLADAGGAFSVSHLDDDTITIQYSGTSGGIQLNWSAYNNPWIYFDAGNTFEFKFSEGRLVQVHQRGGLQSKVRSTTIYYDGDNLPEVAEPDDKDAYVQKWQLQIATERNGTYIRYEENINKAELDSKLFGDDYSPQTKNQTYYYDEEKTQPVNFVGGVATLDKHMVIYHVGVDYSNTTVARFEYSYGKLTFTKVSETTELGYKVTTLRAVDTMNGVTSFMFSVQPQPSNAQNKSIKITFVETPTDDAAIYENVIELDEREYATSVTIVFPVNGEYLLKVECTDGSVCEYIRILPKQA